MSEDERRLSIGEVARTTGCQVETIRYYERAGLLAPPVRTEGGHRAYDVAAVKRLSFIRRMRELGFPLDDVRELLGLVDGGDYACADIYAMAHGRLAEVRRKIADLQRIEAVLLDMTARCERGETPDCPIVEELFQGEHRPGISSLTVD